MATETQTQTTTTTQIPVRFTTQTRYVLPSQRFMVPASWRRRELSQLVNKALALPSPVPFDFLARGILVRSSLSEWLEASGAGTEETLELEYVESLLPPRRAAHIPHDDWVSAVSCDMQGHFVTAAYDGHLRVFDSAQQLLHADHLHSAPVTALCAIALKDISPYTSAAGADADPESQLFASTSHDGTGLLSLLSLPSSASSSTKSQLHPVASLHAHSGPVSALASSSSGGHLLTGGWDSHLALWDTRLPALDEVSADTEFPVSQRRKRRKVENADADANVKGEEGRKGQPVRKAPVALLRGHSARVSGTVFAPDEAYTAYSCAYDGTLRAWDVERQLQISSLSAPDRPFLSLIHLTSASPSLLAASSADRAISVYDTRILSTTSGSTTLSTSPTTILTPASSAGAGLPTALAPSPAQPYHLASGGSDGAVRVWDIRAPRAPLAGFRAGPQGETNAARKTGANGGGDAKVLALAWARGLLAAGGEAGLDVWRVPEPSAS